MEKQHTQAKALIPKERKTADKARLSKNKITTLSPLDKAIVIVNQTNQHQRTNLLLLENSSIPFVPNVSCSIGHQRHQLLLVWTLRRDDLSPPNFDRGSISSAVRQPWPSAQERMPKFLCKRAIKNDIG